MAQSVSTRTHTQEDTFTKPGETDRQTLLAVPLSSVSSAEPIAGVAPFFEFAVVQESDLALKDETAALAVLDSLFGEAPSQIALTHYHMPILMTRARGAHLLHLAEAWAKSGLFYSYNLVLLGDVSDDLSDLMATVPEALEHLAVYSGDAGLLQQSISTYLSSQDPHLYFCDASDDADCVQAAKNRFLVFSLAELSWLVHERNGFRVQGQSARALAQEIIGILESAEHDWETLQYLALQGQSCLAAV